MSKQFKLIPLKEFEEFLKWKQSQTTTGKNDVLSNPNIPSKIKLNMLSNELKRVNDDLTTDSTLNLTKNKVEETNIPTVEENEVANKDNIEDLDTPVIEKPPIYPIPMERHPTPDTPVITHRRRYDNRQEDFNTHKFVVQRAQIAYTSKRAFPAAVDLMDKIKLHPGNVSWDSSGKLEFKGFSVDGYLSDDLQYFFTTRQAYKEPWYVSKWWKVFHALRFDPERIVRDEAKKKYILYLNPRKGAFNFNAQSLDQMLQQPISPVRISSNASRGSANSSIDLNKTIHNIELSPNKFAALNDVDEIID